MIDYLVLVFFKFFHWFTYIITTKYKKRQRAALSLFCIQIFHCVRNDSLQCCTFCYLICFFIALSEKYIVIKQVKQYTKIRNASPVSDTARLL